MSEDTLFSPVAAARKLGGQYPDHLLPCPECAAEVKGANLTKHLRKVHEVEDGGSGEPLELAGSDSRIVLVSLAVLLATMFGTIAVVALAPADLGRPLAGVSAVVLLGALGFMLAAFDGRFRAFVTVENSGVRVSWLLGFASHTVTFPVTVSTGGVRRRRSSNANPLSRDPDYVLPGTVESAGGYIALTGANGGRVVLGAKNGPRLGAYWDPSTFENAGPRFSWDVQLDAAQLAQIQYVLAERGLLRVRGDS